MKTNKFRTGTVGCALLMLAVLVSACSTTRRLGQGETRYTGVGKFEVNTADGKSLPAGLMEELDEASYCNPNNYFLVKFLKIPVGLWVYNNMSDSSKGLKKLIYNGLAKPNVLISEVRPEMRTGLMKQILDNNGYFGSTASFDVVYNEKQEKASVDYTQRK